MYAATDLMSTLMQVLSYLWIPMSFALALAALIVAIWCSVKRRYVAGAWVMAVAWTVFAFSVSVEILMWEIEIGIDYTIRQWVSRGFSLVQMGCEIGFGVGLLLMRPRPAEPPGGLDDDPWGGDDV